MKQIKEFEHYVITESGSVINTRTGRAMKTCKNQKGYDMIILSKNGIAKNFTIHRLVYRAYIGEIPYGLEINHIDGNKSNNHYSNLEAVTHQQNMFKAVEIGIVKSGELCKSSRPVLQIDVMTREVIATYGSIRIATRETGIAGSSISLCINGIRQTAGGFRWEVAK